MFCKLKTLLWALVAVGALGSAAQAVQPDEILDDPVLEARAREISQEVRCLVCRGENIDDSNAGVARDLRLVVRERLVAGDSNEEVFKFLVDRYGEYVLLKPSFTGANLLLWFGGPILLVVGGIAAVGFIRRSARQAELPTSGAGNASASRKAGGLSAEEQAKIDALLKE